MRGGRGEERREGAHTSRAGAGAWAGGGEGGSETTPRRPRFLIPAWGATRARKIMQKNFLGDGAL